MLAILHLLAMFVADIFKSRRRLEAESLFLRHQLNIALRRASPRLRLQGRDRALLVWMTRIWPNLLDVSQVVKPETILRWHRSGFKAAALTRFVRFLARARAAPSASGFDPAAPARSYRVGSGTTRSKPLAEGIMTALAPDCASTNSFSGRC